MSATAGLAPRVKLKRVELLARCPALRTALQRACAADGGIALAPEVADAASAVRAVAQTRPDAVIVDAAWPAQKNLSVLRQIASAHRGATLFVIVSEGAEGLEARRHAKAQGATCLSRPADNDPSALRKFAGAVVSRVKSADAGAVASPRAPLPTVSASPPRGRRIARGIPEVLVVASSTGGPQALIKMFGDLSPQKTRIPVLIVQHMPATFTPILADHITRATSWRAAEAEHDQPLVPGEIRIAPGGHHMMITGERGGRRLRLTSDAPVNFCRPSADVLFVSAAQAYGRSVLAVILTGMGSDGCEGAKAIAAAGGAIFAQDRESSVVWGMPGAAVTAGVAERVLPLAAIGPAVQAVMAGTAS